MIVQDRLKIRLTGWALLRMLPAGAQDLPDTQSWFSLIATPVAQLHTAQHELELLESRAHSHCVRSPSDSIRWDRCRSRPSGTPVFESLPDISFAIQRGARRAPRAEFWN